MHRAHTATFRGAPSTRWPQFPQALSELTELPRVHTGLGNFRQTPLLLKEHPIMSSVISVYNPATEEQIGEVPAYDLPDVNAAVLTAGAAPPAWVPHPNA